MLLIEENPIFFWTFISSKTGKGDYHGVNKRRRSTSGNV
jgi:hypothetical protein